MSVTERKGKQEYLARPFFRKSDFIVVALILALACALFVVKLSESRTGSDQDLQAEIYQENQLLARVHLRGLPAGSYHLADLPLADPQGLDLNKLNPNSADLQAEQAKAEDDLTDYSIEQYIFEADGQGGLKVGHAPCPDRLCERGGYLHQVGDISICVPGQLLVKVVAPQDPAAEADVDLVIGQGKNPSETQTP